MSCMHGVRWNDCLVCRREYGRQWRARLLHLGPDMRGEVMSYEEVAAALGIKRSTVQLIEARALAKLRHNRTVKEMRDG